jgi:N-acetylglucosamine kinase-like BadF-type ATPase
MDLVVDLGQSGARIKIGDEITPLKIAKTTQLSVEETVDKIFQTISTQSFENIFLSLSGLNGDIKDASPFGVLALKYFGCKKVAVLDDGLAAYIGAIGEQAGVVITLGGGVVAVAGNLGKFGHADGKGAIFGDLGGGFWVGQQALRRGVSTLDGCDTADDLVALLKTELISYEALKSKIDSQAAMLCIKSARTVAEGAEAGVESAIEILEQGAKYLAITIRSAWQKVSDNQNQVPIVSIMGGLAKSDFYLRLIEAKTNELIKCTFVEPSGDHLIGAPMAALLYPNGVDRLFHWA